MAKIKVEYQQTRRMAPFESERVGIEMVFDTDLTSREAIADALYDFVADIFRRTEQRRQAEEAAERKRARQIVEDTIQKQRGA